MWANANLKKDAVFIKAVKAGKLIVKKSGIVINPITGRRLAVNPTKFGYHLVSWYEIETKTTWKIYVQRLVWLTFKGPIPKGYQVNHKDKDKSNNRLSNFNLKTNRNNIKHGYDSLSLDHSFVRKVRKLYNSGDYSQRELARFFQTSQSTIHNLVAHKNAFS